MSFERQGDLFRCQFPESSLRQVAEGEPADPDAAQFERRRADCGGEAADFPFFPFVQNDPVETVSGRRD